MRPQEPPITNEHGEAECPYDGTLLDLHSDGTWHCWKCGSGWDVDAVRDTPTWRARGTVTDARAAATIAGHDDPRPRSSGGGVMLGAAE